MNQLVIRFGCKTLLRRVNMRSMICEYCGKKIEKGEDWLSDSGGTYHSGDGRWAVDTCYAKSHTDAREQQMIDEGMGSK